MDIPDYRSYEKKKFQRFLRFYKSNYKQSFNDYNYPVWCWFMVASNSYKIGKNLSFLGFRDFLTYWPQPTIRWQVFHAVGWLNVTLIVSWCFQIMRYRLALIKKLFEMQAGKMNSSEAFLTKVNKAALDDEAKKM